MPPHMTLALHHDVPGISEDSNARLFRVACVTFAYIARDLHHFQTHKLLKENDADSALLRNPVRSREDVSET